MTPLDRKGALDLILRVLKGAPWDKALAETPSFKNLQGRDRAFAHRLAAATLRHHNLLNGIAQYLTDRPNIKPPELEALIHMGLCELLFLNTPAHAAVDSAVNLANDKQKGLVNAVLRRASREKDEMLENIDWLAAAPEGLQDSLAEDWGEDDASAIIQSCLGESTVDLTLKHPNDVREWVHKLDAEQHEFGGLRLKEGGSVTLLPGFKDGAWWVQDAAASAPAQMAGKDLKGKRALDMCAAPGGKTLQLAAAGADVVGLDIDEGRLARVKENAARCGLAVDCRVIDATRFLDGEGFDVVLLDAPCSASGTLRRHPDMWVQTGKRDVQKLAGLQRALLKNAAKLTKPGGTLVYAVCSLEKAEGEAQAEGFINTHKNFSLLGVNRIFPHKSQTDGFFFAGFRRES